MFRHLCSRQSICLLVLLYPTNYIPSFPLPNEGNSIAKYHALVLIIMATGSLYTFLIYRADSLPSSVRYSFCCAAPRAVG